MVNKGSSFVDFVRFRSYIYARTPQSLPPLWVVISYCQCALTLYGPGGADLAPPVRFFSVAPEVVMEGL